MKNKNQLMLIGIFLLIFALGSIILSTNTEQETNNNDGGLAENVNDDIPIEELKGADYWVLGPQTIFGEGQWSKPWISGSGTWAEPYLIENCTFDGGVSNSALFILGTTSHFRINNCTFKNSLNPLMIQQADHGIITNCTFSGVPFAGNYAGIWIVSSDNNTIENCVIENSDYYGISVDTSSINNTIINNTIYNSGGYGIEVIEDSHDTLIENNTIYSNTDDAIYIDSSQCQIINNTIFDHPGDYGIFILNSGADNSEVINNTISNVGFGMYIGSNVDSVKGNKLHDINNWGILINNPGSTIFSGNIMSNTGIILDNIGATANIYTNNTVNGKPVYYYYGENSLHNNNFTKVGDPGQIILANCQNSEINGFNLSNSTAGVHLYNSDNTSVSSCVLNDGYYGIYTRSGCEDNTIFNNTLMNNEIGIFLRASSNENNISYNKVINNRDGILLSDSDFCNITNNNRFC